MTKEDKTEKQIRLEKLEKIKAQGINPYPASSQRTYTVDAVSTSKKLRLSKKSRINFIIKLLFLNISFTSGLLRKSRYLFRKRISTSFKPCHFSGKGRKDLAKSL